jgi:PII-like signaling protein
MLEVSVFIDEDDLYNGVPLYEYIIRYLMHHEIKGASVFSAMGGFGKKRHFHAPKRMGNVDESPLLLIFIDEEPKVNAVLPHLKEVVKEGLIVKRQVELV